MKNLRSIIVKNYKWIDVSICIIITILRVVLSLELLRLGYKGIENIINSDVTVNEVKELSKTLFVGYVIMSTMWSFVIDERKEHLKIIVNNVVQGIFISLPLTLGVLGMYTIPTKDTMLLTYNMTFYLIVTIIIFILAVIKKFLYEFWEWENETGTKKGEVYEP